MYRELNDMVQAHQKQIVAWEEDRQRVSIDIQEIQTSAEMIS